MATTTATAAQITLTLTEEERSELASLLEHTLRDTLVEEHRTDSPIYQEHIERREAALRSVNEKLRRP
jgi:hypothetical protein